MTYAIALEWAKANWPKIAVVLCIFLSAQVFKLKGQLKECQSLAKTPTEIKQDQALAGKIGADNVVKGSVKVKPCPKVDGCPECPEVSIDFEAVNKAFAEGAATQAQSVSITPQFVAWKADNALWLGLGWWQGSSYGKIGYQRDKGRIDAMANTTLAYGVELSYKVISW